MTETDKHILLAKWLDGTISDKQLKLLESQGDLSDLEASLYRLKDYDFGLLDEDKLWNKLSNKRNKIKSKSKSIFPSWLSIAASILLLVGAFLWWNNKGVTVIAQNGEQKEILLPNNSKVVLNSGSKIKYFDNNWEKERKLKLEGEAFFNVTKGVSFEVETDEGVISVLGTQFNIFTRENTLKVTCFEGKVKVESKNNNYEKILEKGDGIILNNNESISFNEITNNPSWINGISTFSKTTLKEVFDELERQFNIKLQVENVDLQRKFTGEFNHRDIDVALQKICGAMNLGHSISPNGKTIRINSK